MRDNFGQPYPTPVADVMGDVPTWDDDTRQAEQKPQPPNRHVERIAYLARLLRDARSAYSMVEGIDADETGDWTDYFADHIITALEKGEK